MDSRIEQNAGEQYLVCYYDKGSCNWDQIIQQALVKHKLKDIPIIILAIPKGKHNGCTD